MERKQNELLCYTGRQAVDLAANKTITGKVTILDITALNKMQKILADVVERLETVEEEGKKHKKLVSKIRKLCDNADE